MMGKEQLLSVGDEERVIRTMIDRPECRRAGVVERRPQSFRTLTGGNLTSERNQQIELSRLLPEDQHLVSALFTPLRLLFPDLDWDDWGVEIVEGHDRLVEILPQESTCLIDRQALARWPLLAWELLHVFLQTSLEENYAKYLHPDEIKQLALSAQLAWFTDERESWQVELLQSIRQQADNADQLQALLLGQVSPVREASLRAQLTGEISSVPVQTSTLPRPPSDVPEAAPSERQEEPPLPSPRFGLEAARYLAREQEWTADHTWDSRWQRFLRAFAVCSPVPWQAFDGPVLGMLFRYSYEVDPGSNSTTRRLSLFQIVVEQQMAIDAPHWRLSAFDWAQCSLLILDPQRHPKIACALMQFLETVDDSSRRVLWPINSDESRLAQLASNNRLSEEDDRFFRQATHLQAIWRDILHRNSSQVWASDLLFDALEQTTRCLRAEPELIFVALICNRSMWENSSAAQSPLLRNLRELLWILSQAPLTVLRRLYPRELQEHEVAQARWPMLRRYIKRFLHLAPPILSRLFEQLDEIRPTRAIPANTGQNFHLDTDPDIPHQELHGRIVPLLSRPELRDYHQLDLEQVEVLRIVSLDKHLSQGSGLWRDQRFFRSFLLFFKTTANLHEGGWFHLALWIDKEIDLGKLAQKRELPSTVSGLIQEEGIWEQTYRYQFLTVDQLMHRLKANTSQWENVLRLLGDEYEDLLLQRLREVLDFQFYRHYLQHHDVQSLTSGEALPPHAFWTLPVETYETQKYQLAEQIAQQILADFYRMHVQDKCSWIIAEQNINRVLQEISELCAVKQEDWLEPPEYASVIHRSLASVLQSWSEDQSASRVSSGEMEEAWLVDKRSLLQRLHHHYTAEGMDWTRLLLLQFEQEYRVIECLVPSPYEESDQPGLFKPLGNLQQGQTGPTQEMVPFLCDTAGYLVSPLFLRTLSLVPLPLLRKTLEFHPELFHPLQQAARLLRALDRDSEQHQHLWSTLEDLRRSRKLAQEAAKKQLSSETPPPKESTTPD